MTKAMKKIEQTMLHGELRLYIPKHTYRAFAITMTGIAAVFLLFAQIMQNNKTTGGGVYVPPPTLDIFKFKTEKQSVIPVNTKIPVTPHAPAVTGTSRVAGTFVPSDKVPPVDISKIATTGEMGNVLAKFDKSGPKMINGGSGQLAKAAGNEIPVPAKPSAKVEPLKEWEVDKSPDLDYSFLKRNIIYPEFARKIGKEGKVLIGVLVSETGKVLSAEIEYSDSELFNTAAIEAVKNYARFEPAVKSGHAVSCKVTIPIEFKLH